MGAGKPICTCCACEVDEQLVTAPLASASDRSVVLGLDNEDRRGWLIEVERVPHGVPVNAHRHRWVRGHQSLVQLLGLDRRLENSTQRETRLRMEARFRRELFAGKQRSEYLSHRLKTSSLASSAATDSEWKRAWRQFESERKRRFSRSPLNGRDRRPRRAATVPLRVTSAGTRRCYGARPGGGGEECFVEEDDRTRECEECKQQVVWTAWRDGGPGAGALEVRSGRCGCEGKGYLQTRRPVTTPPTSN